MVENIFFKVLPAGEGKTRWLVEKAFKEVSNGNRVVFLSSDYAEYEKFVLYYRTLFAMYCPVAHVEDTAAVLNDSVVLVDNLIKKMHDKAINLAELKEKSKAIFVTVEGKPID